MSGDLSGPGVLYVESKISRSDILDEAAFLNWYENEHIAEVINTSGVESAFRFEDIDPNADKPYLAVYPLKDIGFIQTDEFKNIKVTSDKLPDTGLCYDLAEFDIRFDKLIQVYDPTMKGKGHTRTLISVQIQLKEGADAEDFDKWYREEHLGLLSQYKGYLRTTRYKLAFARTNDQLKAVTDESEVAEPSPERPTWLSLHEFEVDTVDLGVLRKLTASPWTERIYEGRKLGIFRVYRLAGQFGDEDMFQGAEIQT